MGSASGHLLHRLLARTPTAFGPPRRHVACCSHQVESYAFMDTILRDIRYALRLWTRNPGFTTVAVLTLALGIGANTTMFSIVNATLLKPLPFPEPDRLMSIWKGSIAQDDPSQRNITSMPNYRDWRARNHVFETMALLDSAGRGYNLTGDGEGEPEQISGVRVTAEFFDVLGVKPLYGRTFTIEEEEAGRDRVVILGYGLWTRRYGGDRTLINKTIRIDDRPYTVVGVMPPTFQFQFFSGPRQLWVPVGWTAGDQDRGSNSFLAIGRLKADVSLERARSEMDAIGRALEKEYPQANINQTVRVVPMSQLGVEDLRPSLFAMLMVVGFVLLIACVNVANLMLARAAARQRELAIRSALGAGRARLARQLLTESVLLALFGGVAGLLLAVWGTSLLVPILPANLRFVPLRSVDRIDVDPSVLLFTFAAAVACGILFGLAPAITTARHDLNQPLKDQARGSTGGKSRLRHALVASEVALTLLVLAGAGIMILSVSRLLGVDPGLDPRNVIVMGMSLPQEDLYYGPPDHPRFCQALAEEVGRVPGVVSTSAIGHLPLSGADAGRGLSFEGQPDPGPENRLGAAYTVACPDILKTLAIPLLAGREFTPQDGLGAPAVAMVNQSFAKRSWPNEDAVGKRFKIGGVGSDNPWMTVVGVFRDVRQGGLASQTRPSFMRPYTQAAWPVMSIVTRTASAPGTFIAPVKKALAIIEPTQPVVGGRTMEEVIGRSVDSRRFPMLLLSGFALLALVLAAVGIAGVVGYSVVQRTQEIGLRMALGAQSGDVLRLVIGHMLSWTMLGLAVGVAASFGLLPLLRTLLFGVTPTEPRVLVAVSLVLIGVVVIASYVPARRATRVDPVAALRGE